MLGFIFVAAIAAAAWPLARDGFGFGVDHAATFRSAPIGMAPGIVGVAVWVLGVAAALAAAALYRQRLVALILVGAVGLAVSLTFVLFSAPDLALTQLLVEMVTVILMMLVLHYLPARSPPEPWRWRKLGDGLVALVAGGGIGGDRLRAFSRVRSSRSPPTILEKSYTEGGGTNVVNVILVDFRGFDTMLEITVLGIAGLIVHLLLGQCRRPGVVRAGATRHGIQPTDPALVRAAHPAVRRAGVASTCCCAATTCRAGDSSPGWSSPRR